MTVSSSSIERALTLASEGRLLAEELEARLRAGPSLPRRLAVPLVRWLMAGRDALAQARAALEGEAARRGVVE